MTQYHSITSLQWLTLVGNIWLQSINGPNTDFPAYSSQLKRLLSLSQLQLNNLAFASDAGKLFGWLSGVATLYLPLWLVLLIGSTLGLIGYGVQFLLLAHKIPSLAYWHVFLLTVLAGNSTCWINTVCYMITIKNFPFDRQIAVGLSSSYVGLSAKIYTDIVDNVFVSHRFGKAKAYLLLNSVLPLLVSMIVAPLMREIEIGKKIKRGVSKNGFVAMFAITMATGVYAVLGSLGALHELSLLVQATGLGFLLVLPILVPFSAWMRECEEKKWEAKKLRRVHDLCTNDEVCVETGRSVSVVIKEGHESDEMVVREREDIGVKLMVKRVEFWIYFFVYMFGGTLGLVFMNNLGQIAESRGHVNVSSLVSLSSSFGFFGRLVPSILTTIFSGPIT
ncbi:hypothetical protein Syun_000128 [Stephania yunnanensis]|uniref:Nodulin-like domain-containing protein n=1 Tax=Stephania yunnanensis TaxID=152371 RepID=A0AAP0LCL8_9MAGN